MKFSTQTMYDLEYAHILTLGRTRLKRGSVATASKYLMLDFIFFQLSTARRPSLAESASGCDGPAQEMEEEERESGSMGWHVYGAYLRAGGRTARLIFMVVLLIVGQLSATLCDYWVTLWYD